MNSSATVRTARRRTLRLAAAALTAAAGLTLTACSGSDDAGAKPAGRTDAGAAAVDAGGAAFATGGDAVPDPDAGGATTTSIVLTNKGGSACKIGGFPGVDLKSENGGERWSLARSSKKFSSITLQPGDSTDFTINVAMTKEETGFYQPAFADVTPPNETTSLTVEWPWGTLVDQRSATHPATFVNPIG
ncbi:DUF4232 domain-containing protein [Streptomyces lydicus]|uniref:DUF4232 domain-containing protein n=1 Tax=Streptomyces lydicus TaxID=47763 RepID=UPI0010135D39|nr:DUF4232 domain-containing protein [Streptomyces lydicus]MCZ1010130.1 DUF4232 domain-containing protein [Streptomyces lydicus]